MTEFFRLITPRSTFMVVLVLAVIIGCTIGYLFVEQPGYVLIAWDQKTLETTLVFAATVLFVTLLLIWFLVKAVEWVFRPTRRYRKTARQTIKGLVYFAEGNWKTAERLLMKSIKNNEAALINFLAAAYSASERGDNEKRDEYLRLASESEGDRHVEFAVKLTQARLQRNQKQWERCLATLRDLHKKTPKHKYVLKLLMQAHKELQDWENLCDLMPVLKKQKVISEDAWLILEATVLHGLIEQAAQSNLDDESKLARLHAIWQHKIPAHSRYDVGLIKAYTAQLIKLGDMAQAERVVRDGLQKHWHDDLIAYYGRLPDGDIAQRVLWVEGFIQERPNNAALLLALGRLCLQDHRWKKAREYFELSLQFRKTAETYEELGRLLASLGEHEQSNSCFRDALRLTGAQLPDLPLPSSD